MSRFSLLLATVFFFLPLLAAHGGVADDWHRLATQVRDGQLAKETARQQVMALHRQLLASYGDRQSDGKFVFPMQGYGAAAIGGVV